MKQEDIVIGQEVVVHGYGVGRVMAPPKGGAVFGVCVKTYGDGITRDFAPHNVEPWPVPR